MKRIGIGVSDFKHLMKNRIEDYEENLQEILLSSVSYNDTKKGNEAFYHGLIWEWAYI